jgi:hypothetical protein
MYRADGLGVDFTEDDLPESVRVTIPAWVEVRPLNQFRGTGILNKDVDGSQLYVSGDVFEYREHSGESWVPVSAVISNYIGELYELTVGGDSFGTSQSECLFWKDGTGSGDGNLTPEDDLVEDQFAAEYTLKLSAAPGHEAPLTRVSLCEWVYEHYEDDVLVSTIQLVFKGRHDAYIEDSTDGRIFIRDIDTGDTTPKGDYIDTLDSIVWTIL